MKMLFAFTLGLAAAVAAAQAPAPVAPPQFNAPPLTAENTLNLDLSTGGRVVIQLRPDVAPGHVERVRGLARQGFYDGLLFHRVIDGFMAQTGDPKGTGEGGSALPDLRAEFNALPHVRGTVSMARAEDPNSANSQFFIMFAPNLRLDGKYTVFGRVVGGMAYVDAVERGEPPANPSRIVRATIGAGTPSARVAPARAEDAASAAADAAVGQAVNAAKAAGAAVEAATLGDTRTTTRQAEQAAVAAEAAAHAARDAAEASKAAEAAKRRRRR